MFKKIISNSFWGLVLILGLTGLSGASNNPYNLKYLRYDATLEAVDLEARTLVFNNKENKFSLDLEVFDQNNTHMSFSAIKSGQNIKYNLDDKGEIIVIKILTELKHEGLH